MPSDDVPKVPLTLAATAFGICVSIITTGVLQVKAIYDKLDAVERQLHAQISPVVVETRVNSTSIAALTKDVTELELSLEKFKAAGTRYSGEDAIRDAAKADAIRQADLRNAQAQLDALRERLDVLQGARKRPQDANR